MYKFRGKRKEDGEWVYGSLVYLLNAPIIIHPNELIVDRRLDNTSDALVYSRDEVSVVHPETVGMFTGLTDKTKWEDLSPIEHDYYISKYGSKLKYKGREIFEGDIVYSSYKKRYYNIVFENGSFKAKTDEIDGVIYIYSGELSELERIGNVHE